MRPSDLLLPPTLLDGRAAGVNVRWLGTAGFSIEHDGHVVLIDPYVTRTSIPRLLAGPVRPDPSLIAQHFQRADAIVLGHTHFDHALDAPLIAHRTGARVFGSRSAAALCRSFAVPEAQIVDVEWQLGAGAYETEVGPFRLRFVPSAHSPLVLGRIPFAGEITDCTDVPVRAEHYRCGTVFGVEIRVAGKTLFHLGSAEVVERSFSAAALSNVDLLLLCVPGWNTTERLPSRALRWVDPAAILLSHWDDFTRPLTSDVKLLPAIKMPSLVDALARESRSVRIGTLEPMGSVQL